MNGATQFLGWFAALIAASVSTVGYIHSNFMTVREKVSIEQRLDRIEKKLDTMILWQRSPQKD